MRLLVPVDFSEITNSLLRTAKEILMAHGGEALLLHVVSPAIYLPYPEGFGFELIDPQILQRVEDEKKKLAEDKLRALIDFLKPVKGSLRVEVGDPREIILEVEEQESVDLTVMGSHRKALVERILIGSTAQKVAKHCKKPLLIIKGREPNLSGRVLVAYDFSKVSEGMLGFLLRFLKPFGSTLSILHVDEPLGLPLMEGIGKNIEKEYSEKKREFLSSLEKRIKSEGFSCRVDILKGKDVVEGIKDYISENKDVEVVAFGSKGLSGLKRILLGSNSGRLINELEIPIFLYKEGA